MKELSLLLREIKSFYIKEGRSHLPWRKTEDPYKILVSEVMLQQTQVERVIPKYKTFIKKFPTPQKLAQAKLSEVLGLWSGLGYNRRGKFLHEAAKIIVKDGWEGRLPGVGPYTRSAVDAFTYNKPTVFIETNIRTVFTHFLFPKKKQVSDTQILPLVEKALKLSKMQPRDFYAALMDYGAHLKHSGVRINKQSRHYTKQKKFEGSVRQVRGAILRELLQKPQMLSTLYKKLPYEKERTALGVAQLLSEGLLKKKGSQYSVAD